MAATGVDALIDEAPFTKTHRRVWLLSSMGIMLDGFDFFIMGVALPLIRQEWHPGTWVEGILSAAAIIGAIVGACTLGALTDKLGRQLTFRIDLGMFIVFALLSALAPSIWWLIAFRFLLGVGIGADYPISSAYVSEVCPGRVRSRLLVAAFSFQAIGQILGVFVGLIILGIDPHFSAWRPMLAFGVIPAIGIVWLRRTVPESPKWLAAAGRLDECARVMSLFCDRRVTTSELEGHETLDGGSSGGDEAGSMDGVVTERSSTPRQTPPRPAPVRWSSLFAPVLRKATLLTSVPWFFMDVATYGVGVFTPTIIAAIAVSTPQSKDQFIAADITSTRGAAVVDLFLIIGFALAIWLIVKIGKIRLQLVGFVVMALGLFVLAYASHLPGGGDNNIPLVLFGFAVFNLFMNMGPNATTYVMPAEVFETRVRAAGSGLAAGAGKLGAAIGTLFFPTMQHDLGLPGTLTLIGGGCLIAAGVTFGLRSTASREMALATDRLRLGAVGGG